MRPKKIILCVDGDVQALSEITFLLRTHGYRVLEATTAVEAIELFGDNLIDLVLTDFKIPLMRGDALIVRLKSMTAWIPMILLVKLPFLIVNHADAVLDRTCSSLELLECIRTKSARKRGPRKDGHPQPATA